MNKHTPGPLYVSINEKWPFSILTKNKDGEIVFSESMPCYSTSHKNAKQAIEGHGMPHDWHAEEKNRAAIANAVLRAAAPDLLEALKELLSQVQGFQECNGDKGIVLADAIAAIKKATS